MGASNRCFLDDNLLGPESRWMFYLSLAEALYALAFCLWRLRLKNLEAYQRELLAKHYIVARDAIEKLRENEAVLGSHSQAVQKQHANKND